MTRNNTARKPMRTTERTLTNYFTRNNTSTGGASNPTENHITKDASIDCKILPMSKTKKSFEANTSTYPENKSRRDARSQNNVSDSRPNDNGSRKRKLYEPLSRRDVNSSSSAWMIALSVSDSVVGDKDNTIRTMEGASSKKAFSSKSSKIITPQQQPSSRHPIFHQLSPQRSPPEVNGSTASCPPVSDMIDQINSTLQSISTNAYGAEGESNDKVASTTIKNDESERCDEKEMKIGDALESKMNVIVNDGEAQKPFIVKKRTPMRIRSSKNIVHQLMNRSTYGEDTRHRKQIDNAITSSFDYSNRIVTSSSRSNSIILGKAPKIVPWLQLADPQSGESTIHSPNYLACWDGMGVLLATAYPHDGTIRIYDWDTVLAADMIGRNRRERRNNSDPTAASDPSTTSIVLTIDPIMTFSMALIVSPDRYHSMFNNSNMITFLQWNPFNPDEIVIGSRATGAVYLIDLSLVGSWLDKRDRRSGNLPRRELRCDGNGQKIRKDSVLLFVESGVSALLSTESSIMCWHFGMQDVSTKDQQEPQLLWTYKPWQQGILVTSLVNVSDDVIAVGSSHGHIVLLNWKTLQRTSSFSTDMCPTVVEKWTPHHCLSIGGDIPTTMMGIRHLQAHTETATHSATRCRLAWITSGGWVLTAIVDLISSKPNAIQNKHQLVVKRSQTEVALKTKPVRCINSEGKEVELTTQSWSLPQTSDDLQMNTTMSGGYVVETVPEVKMVLPHHDARVVGEKQPFPVRDSNHKPGFLWVRDKIDVGSGRFVTSNVSLPRRMGKLVRIVVHPSNEWILIGSTNLGLRILNTRR